ncbi:MULTISPECIES: hypothetical protein [Aphanothece]|uniref:hypothetical protein n=1 Tax=Aphanothece TaxID=1121 RepID=UPI0039851AB1
MPRQNRVLQQAPAEPFAMPWWLDLVLLSAAVILWFSGSADQDDVWSLLQRMLAVVALAVVLLGGRQIPLELLALGVALWLPSAGSRRLSSGGLIPTDTAAEEHPEQHGGGRFNGGAARSAAAPR